MPTGFQLVLGKRESDKDEKVGSGETLDISAHFLGFQGASPRVAESPSLFWLLLRSPESRGLVTALQVVGASWWVALPSRLAPSALPVPLQLVPAMKNALWTT